MPEKIFHKFTAANAVYLVFFILFFILSNKITLRVGSDDTKYLEIIQNSSIIDFIYHRIVTWQPRIFSDLSLALMYKSHFLWSVLNSLFLTSVLYIFEMIIRLSSGIGYLIHFRIFLTGLVFCIYPYVVTSGVLWYTGSFHYLWPFTAMAVGLLSFIRYIYSEEIKSNFKKIIIAAASCCACYNEQTMAVLLVFGLLSIAYVYIEKKMFNKFIIFQYALILLNRIVYFGLSTLGSRRITELCWFPDFNMLGVIDKIFQGVNITNSHYINSSNLLFLFFTFLILYCFIYSEHFEKSFFSYILAAVPFIFVLLNVFPADQILNNFWRNNDSIVVWTNQAALMMPDNFLKQLLYDTEKANPQNFLLSYKDLIPSFSAFSVMLFLVLLLYFTFNGLKDKFVYVLLFCAALVSGYIIGFSPTIFASGSRVFFLGNFIMILITAKLYASAIGLRCKDILNSPPPRIIYAVSLFMIVNAFITYMRYYFEWSLGVLWF